MSQEFCPSAAMLFLEDDSKISYNGYFNYRFGLIASLGLFPETRNLVRQSKSYVSWLRITVILLSLAVSIQYNVGKL